MIAQIPELKSERGPQVEEGRELGFVVTHRKIS